MDKYPSHHYQPMSYASMDCPRVLSYQQIIMQLVGLVSYLLLLIVSICWIFCFYLKQIIFHLICSIWHGLKHWLLLFVGLASIAITFHDSCCRCYYCFYDCLLNCFRTVSFFMLACFCYYYCYYCCFCCCCWCGW